MGHVRLGTLPASKRWDEVVALLHQGAGANEIAAGASRAAQQTFNACKGDPGVVNAAWLLIMLPLAARSPDFDGRLWELGLNVGSKPDLLQLARAFSAAMDDHLRDTGRRTDLGEMAQLAATETLTDFLGRDLPRLFPEREDARTLLARHATETWTGRLLQDFFARLTRRCLQYFLSREISHHVGPEDRFGTIADTITFDREIDLHCREAARIVADYAPEWYSKTLWQDRLSTEAVSDFVDHSLRKIRKELARRGQVVHA